MFEAYLQHWGLIVDGAPLITHSSHLLPVRYKGSAAMLKVALHAEEQRGGRVMCWWDGQGAAPVLGHYDKGLLLERAPAARSLDSYIEEGRDSEATTLLCNAIAALHAPRDKPLPELLDLGTWFSDLWPAANAHGGLYQYSADAARTLLAAPQECCVLHGDIHHGNILDFADKGWLAIDPKGLYGERGFDYANLFCNPDADIATHPHHFEQRLQTVCAHSGLARERLLLWILAWCGLSAAWFREDNMLEAAHTPLSVGALALAALGN